MIGSRTALGLVLLLTAAASRAEGLDLLLVGEPDLVRLRLEVVVDGRPVAAVWDETFGRLFAFCDVDGDGVLGPAEARRLPSPFAIRQVLWGVVLGDGGPGPTLDEIDRDGDGAARRDELAEFYRRAGLGDVLVGVGTPPATGALSAALVKALDGDGNGRVDATEWRDAADRLRKLDRNDDELIGPGELVPGTVYPGAAGTSLLAAPTSADETDEALPIVVLPGRASESQWAAVVVRRRDRDGDGRLAPSEAGLGPDVFRRLDADGDGTLAAGELAAWGEAGPDASWCVRLGKRDDGRPAVEAVRGDAAERPAADRLALEVGGLRFDLRAAEGKLPGCFSAARDAIRDGFAAADDDRDGVVAVEDLDTRDASRFRPAFATADRDGDGRLSRSELDAWLVLREQVARGMVLLTLLDQGTGLFERLDADRDGALSARELRGARERIGDAGVPDVGGRPPDRDLPPRRFHATLSHGHPLSATARAPRVGAPWFLAMDRNGDGDVSRREFVGPVAAFATLDSDGDGLIGPDEAARRPPAPGP